MGCGSHVLSPVIIDDFDIARIPFAKFKADTPSVIDGRGPLLFPFALQLMQPNSPQRTEVLKTFGNIECQQQIRCGLEVEGAELVRRMPFPKLAGCSVSPRPDHGIVILRETV